MFRKLNLTAPGCCAYLAACLLVFVGATASASEAGVAGDEATDRSRSPGTNWEGPYFGVHAGYGNGTTKWGALHSDYFAGSDYPADGYNDGLLGGLQLGYNKQYDQWVVGVEGDISFGSLLGYANCGGMAGVGGSGDTCRNRTDWMASLTARVGYATGRSLIYAKAGAAYARDKIEVTNYYVMPMPPARDSANRFGWTVGAGIAYALDSRWSVSAEYDYYDLGRETYHLTAHGVPAAVDIRHAQHVARLGLNYRLGEAGEKSLIASLGNDFRGEFGARIGYSTGRFQKRLFDSDDHDQLYSVLTWSGQGGTTLEAFARLDHNAGWFVKGTLGGLNIQSSRMHDEDAAEAMAPYPYSDTVSVTRNGRTRYGTLDLGLMLERNDRWDLGAFVGYGFYSQHLNAYGCKQVASNPFVCSPGQVVSGALILSENEEWDVARLGLAGSYLPTERLRVSGEIVWFPYAHLTSTDNHWYRPDINSLKQHGSSSRGFEVETRLSYSISRQWSIGAILRYLSLEADGSTRFPGSAHSPMRFSSSRATAFLQSAYRFDL